MKFRRTERAEIEKNEKFSREIKLSKPIILERFHSSENQTKKWGKWPGNGQNASFIEN